MRFLFIQGVLVIISLLTLVNPVIGIMGYYWVSFMSPLAMTWGGDSARWTAIIAITTILSWGLHSRRYVFSGGTLKLFYLFMCWVTLTTIFAEFPDVASSAYVQTLKTFLMVMLMVCLLDTTEKLDIVLWIVLISVGFHTVKGGLITIGTGGSGNLTSDAIMFKETNEFARGGILIFPLMLYAAMQADLRYTRWIMFLCAILTAFAILGTQSRGGAVAFAASLCYYFKLSNKKKSILMAVFLMAVPVTFFMSSERYQAWQARMGTIENIETDDSFQGRTFAWRWAVEKYGDSLIGGGFGAFRGAIVPKTGGWRDAHSIYFELIGEHGIIGLVIYLGLALTMYLKCDSIQKRALEYKFMRFYHLAIAIKVLMIGFFVGGLTASSTYHELYFFYIGIVIVASNLIEKEIRGQKNRLVSESQTVE